jgi:hypothetical protein
VSRFADFGGYFCRCGSRSYGPPIAASGDPSVDFLGVEACLEVADTVQTLTGNVSVDAPEFSLVVGNLFAPLLAVLVKLLDAVDFVVIERRWQKTATTFR